MSEVDNENVIVVPLRDYAFNKFVEEGFYAYPKTNNKTIKDYVAIYRPQPVSAITHVAEVESINQEEIGVKYKAICFGDRIDNPALVVRLKNIRELDVPITMADYPVQNWIYTTLEDLEDAETINDL